MHGAAKHGQDAFRKIAEEGTILRTEVGSGAHGIAIDGTDDRDEMGICIEPASYVIGLKTGGDGTRFEQYASRTAVDRAKAGHKEKCGNSEPHDAYTCPAFDVSHARSGPGDLDLTVYSLRKWTKLAMGGNPSVLIPLFVPMESCVTVKEYGAQLRDQADMIVSRRAGYQFLGYLNNQRESMLGIRKPKVNRPELVAKYGYDTKYASHAVRLGYQGIELMETGRLTLPMPLGPRRHVREIKLGRHGQEDVLATISTLVTRLEKGIEDTGLPGEPDWDWANGFLVEAYQASWEPAW